ncbi:aluminum-activated malate transporter 2-like [Hibiscus syriacus]|nr:aluminum-activated malate transporter 2-like [Hibiscus syriacus]
MKIARKTKKLGQDDPRRMVHSLKVGLAVSLVSLFYYFDPIYDSFGQEGAMWAVLTVVLVFEFSVGATLGKGLNRILATLVAGALGVGVHCLSTLSGRKGKPILVATFVFIIAVITTFMRFFPTVKARYDYGLLIFIMTFCLVSISSYRDDQVLEMAHDRFFAILVGCCVSLIVCMCLCPVWIGEDLHKSVAANMEKLSNFLQAFGDEYFTEESNENNKSYIQGYTSVLTSKSSEETMANFARWEPGHGLFRYRHPWKMYLKVGNLTRDCAYKVEALNSHLNCKIQTPAEIRGKIEEPCKRVSVECSRALREMASTFLNMVRTSSANTHIESSKKAAEDLKSLLKTNLWEEADLLQIIPAASVTSPLLEIIECVDKIAEAVNELGKAASFRQSNVTVLSEQPHSIHQESIQHGSNTALPVQHCVITVAE